MRRLLLASVLAVSACAPLPPQDQPRVSRIEQLCGEHRYRSALAALDAQPIAEPEREQHRRAILAQAHGYRTRVLLEAAALERRHRFVAAIGLLDAAQPELPESPEWTRFSARLVAARDERARRLFSALLAQKAAQLQRDHALYLGLQQSAADPAMQAAVARHLADVSYFSPLIAAAGERALERGHATQARNLLSIAAELAPSPELDALLKHAGDAAAGARRKRLAAQDAARERRYRELDAGLHAALLSNDFAAAREQLALVEALGIHADEIDRSRRVLEGSIADHVAQQVDAGDRLYLEGRIEDALHRWGEARTLSPSTQLDGKIGKGQKFVARLRQLQQPAQPTRE